MSIRLAAPLTTLMVALALPATSRGDELPFPLPSELPAGPTVEAAPPPRLTVDLPRAALVTGLEVGLVGLSVLLTDRLVAPACRWCQPPQLDGWARGKLRWRDTESASRASDALQLVIPASAAVTLALQALPLGRREATEDVLVLVESASAAVLLTQVAKFAVGRLRPDAWARGAPGSTDDRVSFWSGHTAFVFSTAAAATQVARLRGRPGWRWLAAATFGAAALTGYLRIASDRHWLTDVAAGAAVGTATGLVVPLLVFQPADGRRPAVTLSPAPGGLAVLF